MSQQNHRDALKPGYRLHWYTIDKVLGQGGFGITYLAHDTNLDQRVAIKEFLPTAFVVRDENNDLRPATEEHAQQYQWALDRFISEARTLAKFDHHNIVRVLAVFEANNAAYIVMRYEEGQNLEDYLLEHGPLSEQQLLDIILPVIDGLEIVHQAGFIHRDIKPDNIFIREDGSPVLIDFGAAREAMGDDRKTLTTLVSPGYAPIEQYLTINQDQGPWTDIYALGGTMYRAIMCKRPVDALTRSNDLSSEKPDPYRSVAGSLGDQYTRHFLLAIDAAMQHKRHLRPKNLMAWKAQLLGEVIASESNQENSEPPAARVDSEAETVSYSNTTEVIHGGAASKNSTIEGGLYKRKETRNILSLTVLVFALLGVIVVGIHLYRTYGQSPSLPEEIGSNQVHAISTNHQSDIIKEDVPISKKRTKLIVLPFVNMSDDKDQDYFSDGITDDIITDLSRLSNLDVMARNTSFRYKEKPENLSTIGEDLGVTHILEGTVRKSGNLIRINVQLTDTSNYQTIWSDRYDRKLDDVFAVQDDLTRNIVGQLSLELTSLDKELLAHTTTNNAEAYNLFLKGLGQYRVRSKESLQQAIELFNGAISLDSQYARAYGALSLAITVKVNRDWSDSPNVDRDRALEVALKATELDPKSQHAYWALGFTRLFRREILEAKEAIQKAIDIAPSYADAYGLLALINNYLGNAEAAIRLINKAKLLNPYYSWDYPYNLGRAYYTLGKYEKATKLLEEALNRNPNARVARQVLAANYAALGMQDEAEWQVDQLLTENPTLSISFMNNEIPLQNEQLKKSYFDHLRQAGLPE
jgi:serine/threonine protein kinase